MHFSTPALLLFASASNAFHKGLDIRGNLANGACRTTADWERAFKTMRSLPPQFTSARVFASSDCNTLALAVPAAVNIGIKLLVGVWTQDEAHFAAEKQALLNAVRAHPNWQDWMIATSVGSEDLYRKEAMPAAIAKKIYDVRGMLRSVGVTAPVGHVDTWTAWYVALPVFFWDFFH
jgi:exo-beta-1,3-glucanase (GH17 family)